MIHITNDLLTNKEARYKRVILLGLDGLGTYFKNSTKVPNFNKFFESGASTLQVSAQRPTNSAENWGSILHGVVPEKHGLTNDIVNSGKAYDETKGLPSVFKLLHQENYKRESQAKLASFAAWAPVNTGIIEISIPMDRYAPDTHENAFVRWWLWIKHRWFGNSAYDSYVVSEACKYIKDKRNDDVKLVMIHLVDVDEHGHGHGWGGNNYMLALEKMDRHISEILNAVDEANWKDDSLVIMTTDHGGINKGHGGDSKEESTVFLALRGSKIEPNTIIEGDVTNMDTASIILTALGLESPNWFDSKLPKGIFNSSQ
ncbi:hypothetical protein G9A89_017495 [Geosiphon pyriformis]|nr:hypothetical protein G9A89_017495 [Geosiphon pyriformis]